ncbi:MAG: octanoyltransferase [Candidatus Omnitrophica bacterium CG02_land_8_20_14_3_00__42_8]|nr:MAG: octanoyltransferase [Candidatus Omnitrophica bacterium CG02_land_8_20_14_3_00__42_8]
MQYIDLGLSDYKEAYKAQCEIRSKVAGGACENTLIITEHKSVITIGRKGSARHLLRAGKFLAGLGIEVLDIDRGGDITYHGPGQLVAYPIFKLENEARDIHGFLRFLEDVGINFLSKYGVEAGTVPGMRGVWVKGAKIASIGIGVKKWVTYHGMAININPDLRPFSFIKPCGIDGVNITSLENLLKEKLDIEDAKRRLRESFEEVPLLAEAVCKRE